LNPGPDIGLETGEDHTFPHSQSDHLFFKLRTLPAFSEQYESQIGDPRHQHGSSVDQVPMALLHAKPPDGPYYEGALGEAKRTSYRATIEGQRHSS
jgi:hypothetical protein